MSLNQPTDQVVLVDHEDRPIGQMEKMQAHRTGSLHRAFSVFVFNTRGELLLQRRAADKYHSGGLWANTCCSHPRPGESVSDAAHRRLSEEMGMSCDLTRQFSFIYHTTFDDGLIEHELDHVFVGYTDSVPEPDASEVWEWRYATLSDIRDELRSDAHRFTSWFHLCFERTAGSIILPELSSTSAS